MTPHLAQQIVNVCIATMGVASIVGFLAVYIDMNNEEKTRKCLAELIGTIALLFFLLITILIIQTEYLWITKSN